MIPTLLFYCIVGGAVYMQMRVADKKRPFLFKKKRSAKRTASMQTNSI